MRISKDVAQTAKERAREIEKLVVGWVARWGFTTDKSLQFLYPSRPRLGYDLSKRGLLRKIEPGRGVVCRLEDNNGWCYGLSQDARIFLENEIPHLHLVENFEKLPKNPHWSSLQHLLDLQKIFVKMALEKDKRYDPKDPDLLSELINGDWSITYLTEIETKRYEEKLKLRQGEGYKKPELRPDCWIFSENGNSWIEYERSPKSDLPLMYWIQQLSNRWGLPELQKNPKSRSFIQEPQNRDEEIKKFVIVVPTEYQKSRYLSYFYGKNKDLVLRDPITRKYKIATDKPRWNPADIFQVMNLVEILTLDEVTKS